MDNEVIKEAGKILGNKKKFNRVMLILVIIASVLITGFCTGEISRIISVIMGH